MHSAGRIFTITSIGGLRGRAGGSLYAASKFALEGFSESLAEELAPFGIQVTALEPGYFRTDFLDSSSVRHAGSSIADYNEVSDRMRQSFEERNHKQPGDPSKLARVVLQLAASEQQPLHFPVGVDAVGVMQARIARNRDELAKWQDLAVTTDFGA